MSENQTDRITAKDIQALWLLIQNEQEFHKGNLSFILREVLRYSNTTDLNRLFDIGKLIGLLAQRGRRWILTPQGKGFKNAVHWRLWTPAQSAQTILQERKIHHFFIAPEEYQRRPVVIDLFAGVGGLSLGFAAAGFHVALAVENDQQACEAHVENFPQTMVISEDVDQFAGNPRSYLKKIQELQGRKISGIIGGPPCQGFSYIGERTAGDERNLLTSRFMDIVLELKPDFFVMENVPGLLTSGIPPKFDVYIRRLAQSNSEPALSIIDRLPSVPKEISQRDRQFRRRQISKVINDLKSKIYEHLKKNRLLELEDVQEVIIFSYNELKVLISEMICTLYNDAQLAKKILKESEDEVCTIAIASVFTNPLDCKLLDDSSELLRQFKVEFPNSNKLHHAIEKIYADYDKAPAAGEYLGKKVGPVLLHLLERAKEIYDIPPPQILNAASFGTPQNRDRMFIVGVLKELKKSFLYPESTHCWNGTSGKHCSPTVSEAIGDLPDIDRMAHLIEEQEFSAKKLGRTKSSFAQRMRCEFIEDDDLSLPRRNWNPYAVDCSNRTTHEKHVQERLKTLDPGKCDPVSRRSRLHPNDLSTTIRAGTKQNKGSHTAVRPIHYKYDRVISVREGARLMGYPDWMTFHKTKWHGFRLLGNGVPFPLSHAIAKQIRRLLYESLD